MKKKVFHNGRILFIVILSCFLFPLSAFSEGLPEKGTVLPSFELPSPALENDIQYLGVKGENFTLKDIDYRVLLIEIVGVYCPMCYEQAPLFNQLFDRIQKRKLDDKIKMLAVAAGATPMELKYLREKKEYKYPVVEDESFKVHKLLGEPRTPFIMVVDKEGKVLFAHLGVVKDTDSLYQLMKQAAE